MVATKETVARALARHWRESDDQYNEVFWFPVDADDERAPIRLLEVTGSTPATGSVQPFGFRPTREVPYATVIAQVTPDEFERVRSGELKLPPGWNLSELTELQVDDEG